MKLQSSTKQLLSTASVLALSATALLASATLRPANAQDQQQAIYAGGSTLASEAMRHIFDCYFGNNVGGDGFTVSSTNCFGQLGAVQGMYAGVGSGNGFRGYIANDPSQWYGGTVNPPASTATVTTISIATPFPAGQPPYVDSSNPTTFGAYPYPRVDIGFSDSPLTNVGTTTTFSTTFISFNPTTNWSTGGGSTTSIVVNSTNPTSTYNTSWGAPIQLPAFEVNVAIAVNVNGSSLTINSQVKNGTNFVQGGAIQLTTAQLCAIFSGLVTDWSSTANIPTLDASGNVSAVPFDYANVGSVSSPQAYSNASLPITLVYRSDGSGTSFIITNYLHAVCPLFAPVSADPTDQYKYRAIFGAVNPGTTFSTALINKITAARGNGPWNSSSTVGNWLGENGSGGVAGTINNSTTQAGFIGYVSADFTAPYAIASTAPQEASVQDEALRLAGVTVPSTSATLTFIPPTPTSADVAWNDSRIVLSGRDTNSTYQDFNIYAFTATSTSQGGVNVSGLPVLPVTAGTGAYPISGTTFMAMYSCYDQTSDSSRAADLQGFLSWYYTGPDNSGDPDIRTTVNSHGFQLITATLASAIVQDIVPTIQGCTGGAK